MFFEDYLDTAREEGREEERANTERERSRAEAAEALLREHGIAIPAARSRETISG